MRSVLFFLFILSASTISAQDDINQFDENGKRHGVWKKAFEVEPEQVRYEGTFDHGKETGLFKFYKLGLSKPSATKMFSPDSDIVEVKFYTQKGNIISEGKMRDTTRIGEWKYYHKDSDKPMMTENYENGILNGEKRTYFENGEVTEKSFYKNGKLDGEMFLYSEEGMILEHLTYENGQLHGPAKFYNGKGELLIKGNYKNNRHDGLWEYYENGELKEEKYYPIKN